MTRTVSLVRSANTLVIRAYLALLILGATASSAQEPAATSPTVAQPAQQSSTGAPPTETPAGARQTPTLIPGQASVTAVQSSPPNDTARYLAGLPVAPGFPIAALTQDPTWGSYARAMNQAFSQLERRQLNNIRVFRSDAIAPATEESRVCVYLFSGPDFLYADAMFSDCTTFVLQGLEPVEPLPNLTSVPQPALAGTLRNIESSLNTLLSFSFFKTKDMREDFERSELKGVMPAILVFMARTGKFIQDIQYISLDKSGNVSQGFEGATRGVKITFSDPSTGTAKTLYYFTSDLADDALKRNPGLLLFCKSLGPSNSLLKAASYLLHSGGFETVRNFLLENSVAILQDDSGIPVRYFSLDRWTLRFFGVYNGPIELFKQFNQPDLRKFYATSYPKPLTFGFGYRWNSAMSTMFLAVKK
ncbi:MAG TPA: hypothetical protein VE860_22055 [Chthoniobacterales bacterium]|nr:hypothetical protein [Chthoniobacterales bacterium]